MKVLANLIFACSLLNLSSLALAEDDYYEENSPRQEEIVPTPSKEENASDSALKQVSKLVKEKPENSEEHHEDSEAPKDDY